jgi:hypothetical protein
MLSGCVWLAGCAQSDEELCEDVRKKLAECGTSGLSRCPEKLADSIREQYECIMDAECSELGECAL